VYALHLRMSELDYAIEPELECPDNDTNVLPSSGRLLLPGAVMLSKSM
jgi:hypothetical protein